MMLPETTSFQGSVSSARREVEYPSSRSVSSPFWITMREITPSSKQPQHQLRALGDCDNAGSCTLQVSMVRHQVRTTKAHRAPHRPPRLYVMPRNARRPSPGYVSSHCV